MQSERCGLKLTVAPLSQTEFYRFAKRKTLLRRGATVKKNGKVRDLFQLIDRKAFDALAEKWEVDKWVRGLTTWELTCSLLTAMVTRLGSYREIEAVMAIPRSTLGDAITNRCYGFFEDLCDQVILSIRARTENRRIKRAIRQLFAIDSTECRVHGSLFSQSSWQPRHADGRQAGCKIHVVWNIDGGWIDDFLITGIRDSDLTTCHKFELLSGKTYVFDRAYNDVILWQKIINAGSHFVGRLKNPSAALVKCSKAALAKNRVGVLHDGIYMPNLGSLCRVRLPKEERLALKYRCVIYRDAETQKTFYFVTSDFKSTAKYIAEVYKKRWAVELLFRWLKGHLDIRYLPTKSKNAVKVQTAIAVLLHLLLQLQRIVEKFAGTLWELLRQLRTCLVRGSLAGFGAPFGCRWSCLARAESGVVT